MAIWSADLTTEDGALGAAQMGGIACLISAGLTMLGAIMTTGLLTGGDRDERGVALIFIALIMATVYAVAGARLRAGKGMVWGAVAAALLLLDLLVRLAAMSLIALALDAILLIYVINGIRGSRALQKGNFDADDIAEIFS